MMKEKYLSKLSRSEASTVFKLPTRMIHLKNNFRNIYKHDILCPRCKKEQDIEEHLFGKCEKLKDLYIKYIILGYEEVFNNNINIERLKQIVKVIQELNLKNNYILHAHICVCINMCACMYICVYMCVYMYMCIYTHVHIYV